MERLVEEMEIKSKEIDSLIGNIISENDKVEIIFDGIINIENYLNSKYKILWILKEPYDDKDTDGNPIGGGWDLRIEINKSKNILSFHRSRKTFDSMIYTSYGILNNCFWDDINDIGYSDDDPVFKTIKNIAYINIKKIPGLTRTYNGIDEAYKTYGKEIIIRQINAYSPDIIISGIYSFGYALSMLLNDLGYPQQNEFIKPEGGSGSSATFYIKNSQIFINAYHPAQYTITQKAYCDGIINCVKQKSIV